MTLEHPGSFIKHNVLPHDLSITEAAKLLGISRPALSRLLNGRAALSPAMAQKIASAFNFPIEKLLEVQNQWDNTQTKKLQVAKNQRTYVPRLFEIGAKELDNWADTIRCRERFPVLLRTLIHSDNRSITSISIAGNDHSQQPGFDGKVHTKEASPWVPKGYSYWEIGTNANPEVKAKKDFLNSINKLDEIERMQSTFIFVTPRDWRKKDNWLKEVKGLNEWKDVRVYDAETLEEWIEQSVSGQIWLADELNFPSLQIRPIEYFWRSWSEAMDPSISPTVYKTSAKNLFNEIHKYLTENKETVKPLHIKTDNLEEALALLALAYKDHPTDIRIPVVFKSPDYIPRLCESQKNILPIFTNESCVSAFLPYLSQKPCIVLCSAESLVPNSGELIVIDLPCTNEIDIYHGLSEMGFSDSEIENIRHLTGSNIAVLRRMHSKIGYIQKPKWAVLKEQGIIETLITLFFVGKWNLHNKYDQELISSFACNESYSAIERKVRRLSKKEDAPCWIGEEYGGIVSRAEVLSNIVSERLSTELLDKVFKVAHKLLKSLFNNDSQQYSDELINGFFASLALLSSSLKDDYEVDDAIRTHFYEQLNDFFKSVFPHPLTKEHLEHIDSLLPLISEIHPYKTKDALVLNSTTLLEVFRPAKGLFDRPIYRGLVTALEKLSWIRETASDAIMLLAMLSTKPTNENYGNKPIQSLKYIFDPILPQTCKTLDVLSTIFKAIKQKFPEIAWELGSSILKCQGSQLTSAPIWISGSYRTLLTTSGKDCLSYLNTIFDECLNWEKYSPEMINDLIVTFSSIPQKQYIERVWDLVSRWLENASDAEKILVREKIRSIYYSQNFSDKKGLKPTKKGARVYESISISDPYLRNLWLFERSCPNIRVSTKKIKFSEILSKQQSVAESKRVEILKELISRDGDLAISNLLLRQPTETVAETIADAVSIIFVPNAIAKYAMKTMENFSNNLPANVLRTFIRRLLSRNLEALKIFLSNLRESKASINLSFILNAPFTSETWRFIESLPESVQNQYWSEVQIVDSIFKPDLELVLRKLFSVHRFEDCLRLTDYRYSEVNPQLLFTILGQFAYEQKSSATNATPFALEECVTYLLKSDELTTKEKTILEAYYCRSLVNPYYRHTKIPELWNLEKIIEQTPQLFALLAQNSFERNVSAFQNILGPKTHENLLLADALSKNAHWIQMSLQHIPGSSWDNYEINIDETLEWAREVLRFADCESDKEHLQYVIGELFSHCEKDKSDNLWPNHAMCEILEEINLPYVARGFVDCALSSQGPKWINEKTVNNDRQKVQKYKLLADQYYDKYRFVSENIFLPLAGNFNFLSKIHVGAMEKYKGE